MIGWGPWAVAAGTVWAGASVLGVGVLGLSMATSAVLGLSASPGEAMHPLLGAFLLGYMLFFSPVLSWIGLLLALPGVVLLLARGLGGWASFLILGLVTGTVAAGLASGPGAWVGTAFGPAAALVFRWVLSSLRPEAFVTHQPAPDDRARG